MERLWKFGYRLFPQTADKEPFMQTTPTPPELFTPRTYNRRLSMIQYPQSTYKIHFPERRMEGKPKTPFSLKEMAWNVTWTLVVLGSFFVGIRQLGQPVVVQLETLAKSPDYARYQWNGFHRG